MHLFCVPNWDLFPLGGAVVVVDQVAVRGWDQPALLQTMALLGSHKLAPALEPHTEQGAKGTDGARQTDRNSYTNTNRVTAPCASPLGRLFLPETTQAAPWPEVHASCQPPSPLPRSSNIHSNYIWTPAADCAALLQLTPEGSH